MGIFTKVGQAIDTRISNTVADIRRDVETLASGAREVRDATVNAVTDVAQAVGQIARDTVELGQVAREKMGDSIVQTVNTVNDFEALAKRAAGNEVVRFVNEVNAIEKDVIDTIKG